MVKDTGCFNTANCCVFKCSNVNNNVTRVNSRRSSRGTFKIIYFFKTTEERNPLENALTN